MRTIFILILLFSLSLQGYAQFKYEKENRINKSDVPAEATGFIDSFDFNAKLKWYKETGLNNISFEAKTKFEGKSYSIEFLEDGSLEDVEIEIKPNEIPSESFNNISAYLSEKHHKYSIEKIQIQYSGPKWVVFDYLKYNRTSIGLVTNYEIVLSSKVEGTFTRFEYLFSKEGEYIHHKQIIVNRTENIEY